MIGDAVESNWTLTFAECGSALLRMKRAIRHGLASRETWVDHMRFAQRGIRRLNGKGGAASIVARRQLGAEVAVAAAKTREANALLHEGAQILLRLGELIDRSTTFEERCALLGVNPTDRHELPADAGFAAIIGLGFEASSQYRIDGSTRGPLFSALWPVIVDAMCASHKGRLPLDVVCEPGRQVDAARRHRLWPERSFTSGETVARVLH